MRKIRKATKKELEGLDLVCPTCGKIHPEDVMVETRLLSEEEMKELGLEN